MRSHLTPIVFIMGLLTACGSATHSASLNIVYGYDSALALSKETGKPVMLDFYFDT